MPRSTGPPRPRPKPKPRPGSVVFEPLYVPEEQERMIAWYQRELEQLIFALVMRGETLEFLEEKTRV